MLNRIFNKKKTPDHNAELLAWEQSDKSGLPPHIVKQKTILEYQQKYSLNVLVETGTYLGDMIEAQKNNFARIYSIELSDKLYQKATRRFKDNNKIFLLQGDSGKKLIQVLAEITQPALFWLDGHYSGGMTALGDKECPVEEELNQVLKTNYEHVILIDDARLFDGTNDYPTLADIKEIIERHGKKYSMEVKDDIIRLTP